jgi:hypothetical protein
MRAPQAEGWTRRRGVGGLTAVGVVGLFGLHPRPVAAPSVPVTQESAGMENHSPPGEQPSNDHVGATARFTFYSNLWVNLHHFLYQWARREAALPAQRWPPVVAVPERGYMAALSPQHQGTWQAALDLYQRQVLIRDLSGDRILRALRHRLTRLDRIEEAAPVLVTDVVAALQAVMPVYRAHWWRLHDEANRRWLTHVLPLLAAAAAWLAMRLAQVYGGSWPTTPLRVDVTVYASWHGAYTTYETHAPTHITIASMDPAIQNGGALETLFHEASHVIASWRGPGGEEGPLEEALGAAYMARRETPPWELGHVIIFYSAGELTRQWLHESGRQAEYEPYAARLGLYARSLRWHRYRQALATHWQPYLDGTIDRTTALQRLVEELG